MVRKFWLALLLWPAAGGTALAAAGEGYPPVVREAPFGPQWLWWGGMVVGVLGLALTVGRRQPTHWTEKDAQDQGNFIRD